MSDDENKKIRLLMVDDSKVMRRAAVKMLGEQFDVVLAEDGVEGWDRIKSDSTVSVVFSDLSMPNLDGYGLLKKIRTSDDQGISGLPVIIVTGAENDDLAREKALNLGASDFITKPFNSTHLLARATVHANYQRITKSLEEKVTLDLLTGLGNKQHFVERLKQDLSFSKRHKSDLSIIRIDLDDFNQLFLKQGKEAADIVLKHVGKLIADIIRKEDTAARIGLSQFAVSLPAAKGTGAKGLAKRILKDIAESKFVFNEKAILVTASIAVTTPIPHPGQTSKTVLEEANLIILEVVKSGGNSVLRDTDAGNSIVPSAPVPPKKKELHYLPISIDQVLEKINNGESKTILKYLPRMAKEIKPLVDLINKQATNTE